MIHLGREFWIGRHEACDLVIDHQEVSNFHIRLYAVRTSGTLSVVCLHDLSSNGIILNGTRHRSGQLVKMKDRELEKKYIVLMPGDEIVLPGSQTRFTYYHHDRYHLHQEAARLMVQNSGSGHLFSDNDTRETRLIRGTWKIYNYPLGSGSFGIVHLATHVGNLQVACKTVSEPPNERHRATLQREIKVLKTIDHPNVLSLFDVIEEKHGDLAGMTHMFLQLVTGGDLFSYMEKHRALCEDEVRWMGWQLLGALAYLHGKNIAHRDIKPENILLFTSCQYPHLVIGDFGSAITFEHCLDALPSSSGPWFPMRDGCGTVSYMPPERLERQVSHHRALKEKDREASTGRTREEVARRWFEEESKTDIWAMGVVLWMMGTALHPYDHDSLEYTATPNLASELASDRAFDDDVAMLEASEGGEMMVAQPKNNEHMAEVKIMIGKIDRFKHLPRDVRHWPIEHWSLEGINFVDTVLVSDPEDRTTASIAREHMWFELQEEELNELHKAVVVKGSVPTPYRRWAKCKKESEELDQGTDQGTAEDSEGDEQVDGLGAERERQGSGDTMVELDTRGLLGHLTRGKKRRVVPDDSPPHDARSGGTTVASAENRNGFAILQTSKRRKPTRRRDLVSPSPSPIISATPKTADAANALIDFASTGFSGGRDLVQA